MKKLYFRIRYRLKKVKRKVWWNRSFYISEQKFPMVNFEEIGYVDCRVGVIVPMKDLGNGLYAYYKVVKTYRKSGGDWLRSSDNIECDMKFETVRKGIGIAGVEKKKFPNFISY